MYLEIIYLKYTYKKDMALNNLLWLIFRTKPNQTKSSMERDVNEWMGKSWTAIDRLTIT